MIQLSRYVEDVQEMINSTHCRSINTTPFELMIGVKMKTSQQLEIRKCIEDNLITLFQDQRNERRSSAVVQIAKVQAENRRNFNRRRKPSDKYSERDLVAIKRTQFGPGFKLKPKFLGPYQVSKVKPNNTYDRS